MKKRPNLILIVLDTARAKNFSCYGYKRKTTPYLEKLCEEATLFRNAFAAGIWTIPSHASIFTGTYPSCHGALNLHRHLDERHVTLAELLDGKDYETVAFSNNGFISLKEFGLARGFGVVEGFNYPKNKAAKALCKGLRLLKRTDDTGAFVTNRFVRKWLRERGTADRPFFLFLNYMEAHAPYVRVAERYLNKFLGRAEKRLLKTITQDTQKYLTRSVEIREEDFAILRSVYDAQIAYLDSVMQDLSSALRSFGLWDNSIIVITSDHGDLIGEHGLVHHSYSVHEELIKVPLIVKLPGQSGGGTTIEHLVSLVDLFPTIMDITGAEDGKARGQQQGMNLFSAGSDGLRDYVYVECERPKNEFAGTYPDFDFSVYDRQLLAIRSKRHKYIWASDGRHCLFDLDEDPAEQNNILGQTQAVAGEMDRKLMKWYGSFDKYDERKSGQEIPLDAEVKQRLQALGYF